MMAARGRRRWHRIGDGLAHHPTEQNVLLLIRIARGHPSAGGQRPRH